MEYVKLGRTGLEVSRICLGRMSYGSADSGNHVSFHFCPSCGSTIYWQLAAYPEFIAVALGMFADPTYPTPKISVWERTRHPWTQQLADCPMEHSA